MKKYLVILIIITTALLANNYTYLVDEYTKEISLEAKIVIKMAKDMLKEEPIKLCIPDIKELDRKIYSKDVVLVESCKEANFVFEKYSQVSKCRGDKNGPHILTSNYKQLLYNKSYFGAFFWSKSRPNIVLIKKRLLRKKVQLPREYEQFIEDL